MSGIEAFCDRVSVSRETLDKLSAYAALLEKWNPTINLVAASTLPELWTRHFLESAAAFEAANQSDGAWVDLGTGGGFPGAVVAILAQEKAPDLKVTCIEADLRKASFLRSLSATVGTPFHILSRRIEDAPPQQAQIVSARALAPLHRLLDHALRHLVPDGRAIFLKGESWRAEVEEALETFRFSVENRPSPTHPGSAILVVGDISRA
ncbi:16S rRNA (guanine(527)-N(7))-methyltransferase RsmG [Psychromarinibacter sp. C21-152]|uniref:Ribosomal RNA small subunit methyltransferase G n=1 Tax=Psychromarinibacter sediminicola TaxID=3033385 RepID=A0AAE3NNJ8_9RHOB|nr:16S rRNA (guanine(527)-N(7))-methyltransferase RsmG [Psychromarinibacter sediminicola]MDF0601278.1 16S rRNA (guanine(527)-N(7))-methyltransferase RsmG [Psychromarinibacter sediminicola]